MTNALKKADEPNKPRCGSAPRLHVSRENGMTTITVDHSEGTDPLAAFGTSEPAFLNGLIEQLLNATVKGQKPNQKALDFLSAAVAGMEPQDQVEAMLLAQMATVHTAVMAFARRLNNVENIQQQDSAERAFNKLARTYASQVEALKRYRSKGEQKMVVEHVTVNEGGQAIVGNVEAPQTGAKKNRKTTP